MVNWAKLGDLAAKSAEELERTFGLGAGALEQSAAAAERMAGSKLLVEAQDVPKVERRATVPPVKDAVNAREIGQAIKDLRIGQLYHGGEESEAMLLASRGQYGLTLEAPPGHDFEIAVAGNFGYASKATKAADGVIYEHSEGIAYHNGSRKLHIGSSPDGESFVKSLDVQDGQVVGLAGPDSPSESWYRFREHEPFYVAQKRDVYASPTRVYVDEDLVRENVVEVTRDGEMNLLRVKMRHPINGETEELFGAGAK